ncbi:hypothetical protein R1sor_009926 [Riccia sorocarpa]|uniref:Uncharacterized protein n=1 Tax=Riccia sorocarpa TaxID=122646 RepID=A0ABD3HWG7_9MARC
MRWRTIQHVDKYGPYQPPAGTASTSTLSPLLAISLEEIVQQALQPAMDQLAERLCTELPFVRGETHSAPPDPVLETGRVTRLHVTGFRPPPITVDNTIQIPSRRGPLSISGSAAQTYRTCNSTYWGVPTSIPTREAVIVWGRRWIVKESTVPNTGLGVFALDRIVVEPNTDPDMYPQLLPYVGAVYKHRQYRIMKRGVPFIQEYILDTSQRTSGGPQKRRYIDGDPVRTGNIAGYIQSSLSTNKVSNAE